MKSGYLLAAVVLFAAGPARAQNESLAEALFRDARTAMKTAKYEEACPKFAESYRLDPSTGTLLNLALCEEELGHVATAWTKYNRLLDTAAAGDERRAVAERRMSALQEKLPWVTIAVSGSSRRRKASVKFDGVVLGQASLDVKIPVDPGEHTITFEGTDGQRTRPVQARAGEHLRIEIDVGSDAPVPPARADAQPAKQTESTLRKGPEHKPRPLRTAGYVSGVVGLTGLVGAGIFTGVALAQKGTVEDHCPNKECDADGLAATERGSSMLRLADVGLVVGVVGLAVGGVLLWQSSKVEVSAHVSGSTVTASARWSLP